MFEASTLLLTTGEFAKLCNVSKHTLFHYDDIGLLSPSNKGLNGYRYYSFGQIEEFYVISVLKETGLSLTEIKEYIIKKSASDLLDLLEQQKSIIQRKLDNLSGIKKAIDDKIKSIKRTYPLNDSNIFIKKLGSESITITKSMKTTDETVLAKEIIKLYRYCNSNSVYTSCNVGSIKEINQISKPLQEQHYKLFIRIFNKRKTVSFSEKKSGKYLIAYHRGDYTRITETYLNMIKYAENNNLKLIDPIFEIAVIDQLLTNDSDKILYEVSIRINEKHS